MAGLAAAALAGDARRLVQRDQVIVAVKHEPAHHLGIGIADPGDRLRGDLAGLGQGGHAHLLAGLDPHAALDPTAIDAQLALAAQLFDASLAQMREFPPQPPVEPLIAFARSHRDRLHPAHAKAARASAMPQTSPPMDRPTDNATYSAACPAAPRS